MDREYLKHIDSSPYVDEGFFDTAKAAAAGVGQRAKNYFPSEDPYETPLNAKLQSYYNTLINELKDILKEFSLGPKSPAERLKRSHLSPEQEELINSLTGLYQTLVPSVFPAGTRPEVRGATVQRTINPPNVSFTKSVQHLAREAWFGRAGARSGGEVDSIINKYVNDVKAAYSRFIKNIGKYFPGVLTSKVSDSFKTTLGNPKISKTLDKIESVAKTDVPAETPESGTPPPLPTSTPPDPSAKKPSIGKPSAEQEKKNANDLATLIAATLNIISARVIEDKNSRPYYSKPLADGNFYLPKTVDEPYPLQHSAEWNPPQPPHEPESLASLPDDHPIKKNYSDAKAEYEKKLAAYRYVPIRNEKGEIVSYTYKLVTPDTIKDIPSPIPHPPTSPEPSIQMEDTPNTTKKIKTPDTGEEDGESAEDTGSDLEITGEFLYDFASLYRKYHGNYSIEVTKTPVKVVFSDGRETVIRVFWNWKDHLNTILIQTLQDGKSWKTSELLKFYDDEVNPQSSYHETNFNIDQFLEHVNPNAKALYTKVDTEKDNEVKNALKIFRPAAYAVIRRKGVMEFKSYKSLRFHVPTEWEGQKKGDPHWGDLKLLRGKFGNFTKKDIIPFKSIYDYYYTKKNEATQTKFEDALNEADYWNSYIGIKDEFKEPAPITTIDDDERSIDASRIPAALDAIKSLVALGHKEQEATKWIQQIVDKVGPDKTTEEYFKLAKKTPTLAPTVPKPSTPTPPVASKSLPPTTTSSDPKVRPVGLDKIPAAVDAIAELKKMKVSLNKAWDLVGKAVETLGPDKTKNEYVQFASEEYKTLPPAETAPESPKAEQPPASSPEQTDSKSHMGLTFDSDTGIIKYHNPKKNTDLVISPKKLKTFITQPTSKTLLNKLKLMNYPFEKFGINIISEGMINPFQLINFI